MTLGTSWDARFVCSRSDPHFVRVLIAKSPKEEPFLVYPEDFVRWEFGIEQLQQFSSDLNSKNSLLFSKVFGDPF